MSSAGEVPGDARSLFLQRHILQRLANLKLGWLLTVLVVISVGAYVGSFFCGRHAGEIYRFIGGLCDLIAGAALSTAVIGFAYEWLIRREASETLQLMFDRGLTRQGEDTVNAMVREIPLALLLDKRVQQSVLFQPAKVEEVIRGALSAKLGDEEMSGSIYDGLLQKTFSYTERYVGLRVEVTLSNVPSDEPEDIRRTFYDVVVTLRYRTKLTGTRFIFARALDHDQFNTRLRHPDYIFTWRVEESPGLPRDSSRALDLYRFTINDQELPKEARVTEDGAYEVVCEDPHLEDKVGTEVSIHYAVKTKLRRHDHVFFYTAVRPTKGVTVIFNYARTDIKSVLTYDFFVSGEKPVIYQTPPENPNMAVVEMDEWIFPKGGVAFVWRLEDEGEEDLSEALVTAAEPESQGAP